MGSGSHRIGGAGGREWRRRLRRVLLGVGVLILAAGAMQLLLVARADEPRSESASGEPDPATPQGDPLQAEYWRYCAIDGFLSSCCGGTHTSCPPGTEMSTITWLGTCRNPVDGKDYIISYNDCCGKDLCGQCFINRNEGDKPVYFAPRSNEINWCMGSESTVYNSTVAIVVGVTGE